MVLVDAWIGGIHRLDFQSMPKRKNKRKLNQVRLNNSDKFPFSVLHCILSCYENINCGGIEVPGGGVAIPLAS